MRALTQNRIELVESYAELPRPLDDVSLDRLADQLLEVAADAGRKRFPGPCEILIHIEPREGAGAGPAVRVTVMAASLSKWFPRSGALRVHAQTMAQRGQLFVRSVLGALTPWAATGRKKLGRTELRRKAPGKLLDLFERIEPAGMLKVERFDDLAAREKEWLSDEIANLRRAVHSDKMFAVLMQRLRKETEVPFLPARIQDLKSLAKKMVGVPLAERRLHRRRAFPRFADRARHRLVKALACKLTLNRSGTVCATAYFSD